MEIKSEVGSNTFEPSKFEIGLSRYGPWTITIFVLILYLSTIHNRVTNGDCGELAAAAYNLGVAHPTGYPLYTLLGHLFVYLPFPSEFAGKLAVMSALFGAATVFVVSKLCIALTSYVLNISSNRWKATIPALFVAATYGLAPAIWQQARVVEVYSLHSFLVSSFLWFLLRFEQTGQRRFVSLAAIPMALGFAHHMTMSQVLLATFVYMLIKDAKFLFSKYLLWGLLAGVGGALFYLYLPIADIYTKGFPWGNTSDPKMFWDHVTGQPYHYLLFGDWERTTKHFLETPKIFWDNFFLLIPMIVIGIATVARKSPAWIALCLIYLLLSMSHAIGYDVSGYKSYYVAPFVVITMFSAVGTSWLVNHLDKIISRYFNPKISVAVLMASLVLTSIYPSITYAKQWKKYDLESPYPQEYGIETTNLPPGSILLHMGDTNTHVALYYQQVHGKGPDVAIITNSLLKRPWYEKWVKESWPWFSIKVTKSHRRNNERALRKYYGKRRIFTRHCGEKEKRRPRGPYKLLNRGWLYEFIKQPNGRDVPVYIRDAILTDSLRRRKPYSSKRTFDPADSIALTFRWKTRTDKGIQFEWSSPDGELFFQKTLLPKKRWIYLPKKGRTKGKWFIRGFVEDELILEIPFEIR